MSTAKTMVKLAALPEIFRAAQLLEHHGLLLQNEKANEVVKRYMAANPDINEALQKMHNE
jgi:hypothetical protein